MVDLKVWHYFGTEPPPAAPRLVDATYDEARDRINLEFDRGFAMAISPRPNPGFQDAAARELKEVEILALEVRCTSL